MVAIRTLCFADNMTNGVTPVATYSIDGQHIAYHGSWTDSAVLLEKVVSVSRENAKNNAESAIC